MIEYTVAQPGEMNEIIDFINMVFSMLRVPHNFARLLPKVYDGEGRSDIHVIAREDGRICGCLAMLPIEMEAAGVPLKCGYIGSMSVHPRMRGRGVMGELMRRQIARAREQGMDLMALGGQRQRYEHLGFSACGTHLEYVLNRANVRHAWSGADSGHVTFRPMETGEDEAFAMRLYEKRPITGARSAENFRTILRTFENEPWMILENGQPIGYLAANGEGRCLSELEVPEDKMPAALKAWIERGVPSVRVSAAPWDGECARVLSGVSEEVSMGTGGMFKCLKPDRVLLAALRLKNRVEPLEDGELNLGFGEESLRIRVQAGEVSVEHAEGAPDIALDENAAHRFAFEPNRLPWKQLECRTPRGWFPAYLRLPEPEHF